MLLLSVPGRLIPSDLCLVASFTLQILAEISSEAFSDAQLDDYLTEASFFLHSTLQPFKLFIRDFFFYKCVPF